jgi:uncharacterized protein YkwD
MKKIGTVILFFILIFVFFERDNLFPNGIQFINDEISFHKQLDIGEDEHQKIIYTGDLYQLMDKEEKEILAELGEPVRKDLSAYGYEWWIYENLNGQYLQIGMESGKPATLFAIGENLSLHPIKIGDSYENVAQHFPLKEKISYENENGRYQFIMDEISIKQNPLIQLSENLYMQLYFDTFENKLSSIRLLTGDTLLLLRSYGIQYYGSLPENRTLSETDWKKIEIGNEKQIFAITNVLRNRFQLPPLKWDEEVSQVAFRHSEDMYSNHYFSHVSKNGDTLKERLSKGNILYLSAGENIAAKYVDGPAAVEGWLNSEGHRKAMLNEHFTHLGVGVYRDYYTQNFLQKF